MRGKDIPIITILLISATATLISPPALAATDDMNLTGMIHLSDGTSLSNTVWANNTSFAIYVDHGDDWNNAWRYPQSPGWYTTSMGAYSIVLPADEKDKNWGDGDWYRVEIDASAILGTSSMLMNATSNGTGDTGEFTPHGYQNNSIVWSDIDNWQRWDVVVAGVDLVPNAVAFAGVEFPGPYLPGEVLGPVSVETEGTYDISANASNTGVTDVTTPTTLAFFDSSASVLMDICSLSTVPSDSTRPDGWRFNASWTAPSIPGDVYINVTVDYFGNVTENREDNNIVRVLARVTAPGLPDFVPVNAQPPSLVHTGLDTTVRFSVQVRNQGTGNASTSTVIAFYNSSTPGLPFKTEIVPSLNASETSAEHTADWTSPSSPGIVTVTVAVDYLSDLNESDEGNNLYTWTVNVTMDPVTSMVIGQPNYTSAFTYITTSTPLDFSVVDQSGMGIRYTTYRIDNATWENYTATGQFFLAGEGGHYIEWYSEDHAGNVESVTAIVLMVDDTPPTSTLSIGNPKYLIGGNFITSSTPLGLQAIDRGVTPVGLDHIEYRTDGGGWNVYSSQFFLTGEGTHIVDIRSHDLLTNEETISSIQLIVDDTPPTTNVSVGQPKYQSTELYITSSTGIDLTPTDGGAVPVGLDHIQYRIDGDTWQQYTSTLTLTGNDGPHVIEYNSTDLLGNIESVNTITLHLDNTPPSTALSPAMGPYTLDTMFTFTASDSGCGLNVTKYRMDGGSWIGYSDGFSLTEGDYNISFYSIDNLDNTEEEKWLDVTVQATVPNTPPTVTITSPANGEEWSVSSSHTVTWTMHDDQDSNENLTIYVNYTTQETTYSIVAGLQGIESYLWTLPDTEADDVVINITIIDTGGLKGWDESHVTIKASPPPSVETNYKPLIALIFAVVLAVIGLWSSRKRPWKGGEDRRAVAMSFAFTCLPFIIVEVLTGILSVFVDPLKIPPAIGWGTGVDVVILVVGLLFSLLRLARKDGGMELQGTNEQEQSR